jgi:hypothetical protein
MEGMLIDCVAEVRRDLVNVSAGAFVVCADFSPCSFDSLFRFYLQGSKLLLRSYQRVRCATTAACTSA